MDRTSLEFEKEILDGLEDAFRDLPGALGLSIDYRTHPPQLSSSGHYDAELEVSAGRSSAILIVEIKRTVFPRDVRDLAWRLRGSGVGNTTSAGQPIKPLVAAQSISEGARQALIGMDIGYFDTSGSLYLILPEAHVFIDRPPPKAARKPVRGLFSGKRARVVLAILASDGNGLSVKGIAEMADVSPGTASETLTALERMEWLDATGSGPTKMRHLIDASGLLDEWRKELDTKAHRLEKRRYYVGGTTVAKLRDELASRCDALGLHYALTGEIAAQHYAPHLSSLSRVTCRLASSTRSDELLKLLAAKPVTEGANLEIIETPGSAEFIARQWSDGAWYASAIQVYLDLLRGEGRSRDAAEHLRHEVLRY